MSYEPMDYAAAYCIVKLKHELPLTITPCKLSDHPKLAIVHLRTTNLLNIKFSKYIVVPGRITESSKYFANALWHRSITELRREGERFGINKLGNTVYHYENQRCRVGIPNEHQIMQSYLLLNKYKGTKYEVDLDEP